MFGKKTSELSLEELKKIKKVTTGLLIGIAIVWIFILGYMNANGNKNFTVFIAVAVATMIPNYISIMNIFNEIKKREQNKS